MLENSFHLNGVEARTRSSSGTCHRKSICPGNMLAALLFVASLPVFLILVIFTCVLNIVVQFIIQGFEGILNDLQDWELSSKDKDKRMRPP